MDLEHKLRINKSKKIYSVADVKLFVDKARKDSSKIGLITGCFDILHIGHIKLFRRAKQKVDVLIVGVDSDETAKLKSLNRPINDIVSRCETLAELISIDFVFPIPFTLKEYAPSTGTIALFEKLTREVNPDCLITNPVADDFWKEKVKRARKLGIKFVGLKIPRPTSSTNIAEKIEQEI